MGGARKGRAVVVERCGCAANHCAVLAWSFAYRLGSLDSEHVRSTTISPAEGARRSGPARPAGSVLRRGRRTTTLALVLSTLATTAALVGGTDLTAGAYFVALVVGYSAFAGLLFALRGEPRFPAWPILLAGGALLAVAMIRPPIESADVWSYAAYGRMVAVHQESPWIHVPADHPDDPYTARVAHAWRRTPSVYGPAFVVPAAAVMLVARGHPTTARLSFQLLAALSVAFAMWLVGREIRRNPVALAMLAVNPLVPICVVNAGHNDAWVGVALLWAVLLAMRGRWAWVGVVVALAAMVKVTALLAVAALAVWAWLRAGRRAAAMVAGSAVVACGAMVVAAGGGEVVRAMRWNSWRMTSGSLWAWSRGWLFGPGGASRAEQTRLATAAVFATVAFAGFLIVRHRRASHPALLVGLVVLAYAVVSAYVWPWYVAWGVIPLALCPTARTTRLLVGVGALMHLAAVPAFDDLSHLSSFWRPALSTVGVVNDALPWVLAAAAAAVAVAALRRRPEMRAMSEKAG